MGKKIFVAYSHNDEQRVKNIIDLLDIRINKEALEFDLWSDGIIKASDIWLEEIYAVLNTAWIYVWFLSPNFRESKFINKHESSRALQRHIECGVKILVVPLVNTDYSKDNCWWIDNIQF